MKKRIMAVLMIVVWGVGIPLTASTTPSVVDEVLSLMSKEYLYSFDIRGCKETIRRAINDGFRVDVKGGCLDPFTRYIPPAEMRLAEEVSLIETPRTVEQGEVYFRRFDGVMYIAVRGFMKNKTPARFRFAMDQADFANPLVVIDVRGNGGGKLKSVIEMLRYMSSGNRGDLITLKHRGYIETYTAAGHYKRRNIFIPANTEKAGRFSHYRVVVLVNGRSASAAEIFAGVMKEQGSPVVGQTTYGKGVGQGIFKLSNGGGFKLTTFEYFVGDNETPVNGVGVEPDYPVEDSRRLLPSRNATKKDRQFMKAVEVLKNMK